MVGATCRNHRMNDKAGPCLESVIHCTSPLRLRHFNGKGNSALPCPHESSEQPGAAWVAQIRLLSKTPNRRPPSLSLPAACRLQGGLQLLCFLSQDSFPSMCPLLSQGGCSPPSHPGKAGRASHRLWMSLLMLDEVYFLKRKAICFKRAPCKASF